MVSYIDFLRLSTFFSFLVSSIALPQNGLSHSSTNIDEFVPEDELDAGFLDEEGGSRGKKRTNKPAAKKPPKPVEVEQDDSEDSER